MKIGILTFHSAHNYGAVLQAYALQETLRDEGHEVFIVDYKPDYLVKPYLVFNADHILSKNPFKATKRLIIGLLNLSKKKKRYLAFNKFINSKLKLIDLNLDSSDNNFEAFIYGSDQIWNPSICDGFDPIYFADFKAAFNKINIAYSASMGGTKLTQKDKKQLKSLLSNFNTISVRETFLNESLSAIINKKIQTVLDPSLLAKREVFDNIAIKPAIERPYVLIYQVHTDPKVNQIAEDIAKRINGIVIELTSIVDWKNNQYKNETASPEEFVGYFKFASYVITTSFHGTAFSVIFNRPFYTIKLNNPIDKRSAHLLSILNISNRHIASISEINNKENNDIDWNTVNETLASLRNESKNFLIQNLK